MQTADSFGERKHLTSRASLLAGALLQLRHVFVKILFEFVLTTCAAHENIASIDGDLDWRSHRAKWLIAHGANFLLLGKLAVGGSSFENASFMSESISLTDVVGGLAVVALGADCYSLLQPSDIATNKPEIAPSPNKEKCVIIKYSHEKACC
jgi:hypothetical protein